jgi:hypothetical protein
MVLDINSKEALKIFYCLCERMGLVTAVSTRDF